MYYQQHLVNIFQWGWTMWLENVIKCWCLQGNHT